MRQDRQSCQATRHLVQPTSVYDCNSLDPVVSPQAAPREIKLRCIVGARLLLDDGAGYLAWPRVARPISQHLGCLDIPSRSTVLLIGAVAVRGAKPTLSNRYLGGSMAYRIRRSPVHTREIAPIVPDRHSGSAYLSLQRLSFEDIRPGRHLQNDLKKGGS